MLQTPSCEAENKRGASPSLWFNPILSSFGQGYVLHSLIWMIPPSKTCWIRWHPNFWVPIIRSNNMCMSELPSPLNWENWEPSPPEHIVSCPATVPYRSHPTSSNLKRLRWWSTIFIFIPYLPNSWLENVLATVKTCQNSRSGRPGARFTRCLERIPPKSET